MHMGNMYPTGNQGTRLEGNLGRGFCMVSDNNFPNFFLTVGSRGSYESQK